MFIAVIVQGFYTYDGKVICCLHSVVEVNSGSYTIFTIIVDAWKKKKIIFPRLSYRGLQVSRPTHRETQKKMVVLKIYVCALNFSTFVSQHCLRCLHDFLGFLSLCAKPWSTHILSSFWNREWSLTHFYPEILFSNLLNILWFLFSFQK